jgi:hypothetical protein
MSENELRIKLVFHTILSTRREARKNVPKISKEETGAINLLPCSGRFRHIERHCSEEYERNGIKKASASGHQGKKSILCRGESYWRNGHERMTEVN